MPAPTYMVIVIRTRNTCLPFKSDLERGYAANIVIKVDSNAEPSVRKTE